MLGRSGFYYIAMAAAVVVGGVVAYVQKRNFLRIASSLVGGGCVSLAVIVVCDRADVAFPTVAALGVLVACAGIGIWVQRCRASRRRRRAVKRTEPPVGVPVHLDSRA